LKLNLRTGRIAGWVLAALLPAFSHAASASSQAFEREAFYKHLHKAYGVPPNLKLSLGELKPSPIPGLLSGQIEFGEGPQAQRQPVNVTKDGRYYILSAPYKLGPSKVPGFRSPLPEKEGIEPPPLQVTQDGQFLLTGVFQDMSVDPDAVNRAKIQLDDAVGWGPADAKITIVEYSDFQCPHCKRAFEAIEKDLLPHYAGKVRVVFKYYPLTNIHPWAFDAAVAAACAGRQSAEAGHKMQVSLFSEQASIKKEEFRAKALEFAKQAGAEASAFERCFDKQESKSIVESDVAEATLLDVSGTPTIFVNGRRAPNFTVETLKPIIEDMLAEKAGK